MQAKSLQRFFDDVEPVTLNNCDLEAIHRSGAIQSVGVFLRSILQASASPTGARMRSIAVSSRMIVSLMRASIWPPEPSTRSCQTLQTS